MELSYITPDVLPALCAVADRTDAVISITAASTRIDFKGENYVEDKEDVWRHQTLFEAPVKFEQGSVA